MKAIGGKKKGITRRPWLEFGRYCGIPERAVIGVLRGFSEMLPKALEFIGRSFLDEAMKEAYRGLVSERSAELGRT